MIKNIITIFYFLVQIPNPIHVFSLTGQSNMEGFASVPHEQIIRSNIFLWNNGWVVASEPLQGQYFGPGVAFAFALQDMYGADYSVGLVPCAVSGSNAQQWQKGQSIYQNCLSKTNAALSTQPGVYLSGVIHAQGEANTYNQQAADEWGWYTLQFARDFRTDTGYLAVPFIYAQLGKDPKLSTHPYWSYLQVLQASLQNPPVYPYIRMVKTLDIPTNQQHFDGAESYKILGRRFAAVFFSNFGQ